MPAPFDAVGLGLSGPADAPLLIAVYHHDDPADAQRNADALPSILAGGGNGGSRVRLQSTNTDGGMLVAEFTLDGTAPARALSLLRQRAPFLTHAVAAH